jgi:starch phosphorylase
MPDFPNLPDRLAGLAELAMNLAWSWSRDARALFARINESLWHQLHHNPLELLRQANPADLRAVANDAGYVALYDAVMDRFHRKLQNGDGWFQQTFGTETRAPIAYFCAEFGLHNSVPIYSGGLGVLAGDHCKAASDLSVPLVGVGLFYRLGYFDQHLRLDGWQESSDVNFDVGTTPLVPLTGCDGTPWVTTVEALGRVLHIGAWRVMVGRVPVYLLDTDYEANHPDDRALVSKLYGGGPAHRIRQEWVLGVGGVRVLRALGIEPATWHANEGHAAFMMIERVREQLLAGLSLPDAASAVRRSSVFTTHTPVPAGHDFFSFDEVNACAGRGWDDLPVPRADLLRLGERPGEPGIFHMTVAAIRLSAHVNGVSRQHGRVSREIWQDLWPGRSADAVPIGHITNGVHLPTWMAAPIMHLLDEILGPGWHRSADHPRMWSQVLQLDSARLWAAHVELKQTLFRMIREDARRRFADRWREAAHVVGAGTLLEPEALTIGFARRFATYKRADLIFRDVERLRRLVTDENRPMQIVFAGKAHPADETGKHHLQQVYRRATDPMFAGRIAFVDDYDLHVAHFLVQGCDVWMNNPRKPLEASGTSGMKASINGVPHLSIGDGWWAEGFTGENGWLIDSHPQSAELDAVDAADAAALYHLLETEIVPSFYERDAQGVPRRWLSVVRQAMASVTPRFSARRMVKEYADGMYAPVLRPREPQNV